MYPQTKKRSTHFYHVYVSLPSTPKPVSSVQCPVPSGPVTSVQKRVPHPSSRPCEEGGALDSLSSIPKHKTDTSPTSVQAPDQCPVKSPAGPRPGSYWPLTADLRTTVLRTTVLQPTAFQPLPALPIPLPPSPPRLQLRTNLRIKSQTLHSNKRSDRQ